MSTDNKSTTAAAGPGLSEGLGPLPEPAAWNVYWRGDNDGPSWDQWHDESDPLPRAWEDTPPDEVTPYYTAEQMRAYAAASVAAERDLLLGLLNRCRPIIEADAQMMADISRHAPLDADSQAKHDATEYESERLARELGSLLGPNVRANRDTPARSNDEQ